jgi:hypothetical protein
MHTLKTTLILLILVSCGFGCTTVSIPQTNKSRVMFSLNVHDFVDPEDSFATMNKIIDIHEHYSVPVDIYLTDAMVRLIETSAPDLLVRLKTSAMVAVNYHVRPPYPYYPGFDFQGLNELSAAELASALLKYEEHAVDLSTGETTEEAGGYEHLKELLGYAPIIVSPLSGQPYESAIAKIYKDKGAEFIVSHAGSIALGTEENGLYVRPEAVEVKFQDVSDQDVALVLEAARTDAEAGGFIGVKVHENEFYALSNPWFPIYYVDEKNRVADAPPFDLSLGKKRERPADSQAKQWKWYEDAVAYVAEHPESYETLNAMGLKTLIGL